MNSVLNIAQVGKEVKGNMKKINTGETIGIRRKLDNLGRIVIPKEFRDTLKVKVQDEMEIYLVKDGFFIRKVD